MPPVWPFFLVLGYVLMAIHWWLLAIAVKSLFSSERTMNVLVGMAAFVPLFMTIALCGIAAKKDRSLVISAAAGILSVPLAVTVFCFAYGLTKICRLHRREGKQYD